MGSVDALEDAWRSLPSGELRRWASGSRVTVETLATLMISESDNTATDALVALLGRAAVEAEAPARACGRCSRRARPSKDPEHPEHVERWRAADEAGRRSSVLELAAAPLPNAERFEEGRATLDVEWHFTARELCALLDRVHALPAMRPNPGLATAADWREIAFKGGSERGVLAFATRVERADEQIACAVTTWNDAERAIELGSLARPYTALLSALAGRPASAQGR